MFLERRKVMKSRILWLSSVCIAVANLAVAISSSAVVADQDLDTLFGTAPCYVNSPATCPANNGSCTVACTTGGTPTCPKEGQKEKSQIQANYANTAETPSSPGKVGRTALAVINCTKVTTCTGCTTNPFGRVVCADGTSTQEDSRQP